MARIRTIKPEFFRHEELFEAEQKSGLPLRVAFAGLWTAADREGRFRWRPRQLKLDVLPFDDVSFDEVLEALVASGFIERYTAGGEQYGQIPSWQKHQVINNREADSSLPVPPPTATREARDGHASSTREGCASDACPTPIVHAQAEGEVEGNRKTAASAAGLADARPLSAADRVWAVGPKVLGDGNRARGQIGRLLKTFDAGVLADVLSDAMLTPPTGEAFAWVTAACQARQQCAASARGQHTNEHPGWLEGTGFADVFAAENAGCRRGNAHQFREGGKVVAA